LSARVPTPSRIEPPNAFEKGVGSPTVSVAAIALLFVTIELAALATVVDADFAESTAA
jgi:hypothetical protein